MGTSAKSNLKMAPCAPRTLRRDLRIDLVAAATLVGWLSAARIADAAIPPAAPSYSYSSSPSSPLSRLGLARLTGDPIVALRSRLGAAFGSQWRPGVDSLDILPLPDFHGLHRLRVRQFWNGLPVLEREGLVVSDAGGAIHSAFGRLAPGIAPEVPATEMTETAARLRALTLRGADARTSRVTATRLVARAGERDRIAWAIELHDAVTGEARRVLIDAASASVLRDECLSAHAVGTVCDADPRGGYHDVTLERLAGGGTSLRADKLGVVPAAGYPVVSPTGDFRFTPTTPDTTAFDQVNAYHHADAFLHGFLEPLGYVPHYDSLVVRVQAPLYPSVALTTENYVALGNPIPGYANDVAKGQDEIGHELQHTVTYGFGIQPTGFHREASALHEALSDYMAAAWTGDPSLGEWVYIPYPGGVTRVDLPSDTFRYTNYDHVRFGGVEAGTGWANSMILSGALWALRTAIGRSADSLALEALAYLPREPLWSDFADAMLVADRDHHGGRLHRAILAPLREREILGSSTAGLAGPDALAPGQTGWWNVHAISAAGVPRWEVQHYRDALPFGPAETVGFGASLHYGDMHDFELKVVVPGEWTDSLSATTFVSVESPAIAIVGPHVAAHGIALSYHSIKQGAGPLTVTWWRTRFIDGAPRTELLGFSDSLTLQADAAFRLEAKVSDGLGRSARAAIDVNWLSVDTVLPATLRRGERATLQAVISGAALRPEIRWDRRDWADGAPAGDWTLLARGVTASFVPQHDLEVRCEASVDSVVVYERQGFVNVDLPDVSLGGPLVPEGAGGGLEFFAQWRGLPTQTFRWFARGLENGALERELGIGTRLRVTERPPYVLRVASLDKLGRGSTSAAIVNADGVMSTPGVPMPLRLEVVRSAQAAPSLLFTMPYPSRVHVGLFDVAGREVAVLADGSWPAGARARALPAGLPQGLYLARAVWDGPALTRRVVVLR